jgi:asparagine synthetase B (glutamine-hydrolysing)
MLNKINIFRNLKLNFKNKNLNRIFMNKSEDLFLSFSEQNLFKDQNKIYNNFRYVNKDGLEEILNHSKNLQNNTSLSHVMYHDLDTWVTNDILLRNDKIYANKGIEVRVPFLDQNIIEKSYKEELKMTIKKKLGFNSPFAGWLRKELNEFANVILSKSYYDSSHHINLEGCAKLIKTHKDNYHDPYLIWNLISLQIFLRKFKL